MKNLSAHISLLASNLIWACAYPLYGFVMTKYIDPLPLYTLTITVTALLSLTSLVGSSERVSFRDGVALIGAGLLIALLRKAMLLYGLSMTSPIDGSIIATIAPIVVLVISSIVGLERFTRGKALGVACGFAGALGVILSSGRSGADGGALVGNILILLCAFISAIYVVWFKSLLQRYRPTTVLMWTFCVAAFVTIPIGFDSVMRIDTHDWTLSVWLAVAYLVVMPTYPPNLLLTTALRKVSPTVVSIYNYIQPTVAVTISVVSGIDKLHPLTILFAALIFLGVGIVINSTRRRDVANV